MIQFANFINFVIISSLVMSSLGYQRISNTAVRFSRAKSSLGSNAVSDSAVKMEEIVNLCKKKGFVFQSSEIYSPLSGFFDYGPLGVELKANIKKLWWRDFVQRRDDVVGLDSSIISSSSIWKASGHVAGFSDPMVDCKVSKLRYRADQVFWGKLLTESSNEIACYVSVLESENMLQEATTTAIKIAKKAGISGPFKPLELKDLTQADSEEYLFIPSPATGEAGHLTTPRDFNLMFQTSIGAVSDDSSIAYLRPETAQGIFTNFANVQRSARMKVSKIIFLKYFIIIVVNLDPFWNSSNWKSF